MFTLLSFLLCRVPWGWKCCLFLLNLTLFTSAEAICDVNSLYMEIWQRQQPWLERFKTRSGENTTNILIVSCLRVHNTGQSRVGEIIDWFANFLSNWYWFKSSWPWHEKKILANIAGTCRNTRFREIIIPVVLMVIIEHLVLNWVRAHFSGKPQRQYFILQGVPWEKTELRLSRRIGVYVFIVCHYHMPSLPDNHRTKGLNSRGSMHHWPCAWVWYWSSLRSQFVSTLSQIEVATQLSENLCFEREHTHTHTLVFKRNQNLLISITCRLPELTKKLSRPFPPPLRLI